MKGNALLAGFLAPSEPAEQQRPDLENSEFAGTWVVKDSNGKPFEIALSSSGTAESNRDAEGMSGSAEGMSGTWEAPDMPPPSAVIAWDTGWTTKITRTGDTYTKTAYDTTAATPTNTSPAEKLD